MEFAIDTSLMGKRLSKFILSIKSVVKSKPRLNSAVLLVVSSMATLLMWGGMVPGRVEYIQIQLDRKSIKTNVIPISALFFILYLQFYTNRAMVRTKYLVKNKCIFHVFFQFRTHIKVIYAPSHIIGTSICTIRPP